MYLKLFTNRQIRATHKLLALIFLFYFVSVITSFAQEAPTIIYLVRHAEKVTTDPNAKDPTLTEQGLKRAKKLSKKLKKIKLSAIYSTDYQRTKLTATPTAEKQNLTIQLYAPKNLKEWASQVLQQNKGKHVLIIGHTNTVLETIEAFGSKRPVEKINDDEYGYFFELRIKPDNSSEVVVTHY